MDQNEKTQEFYQNDMEQPYNCAQQPQRKAEDPVTMGQWLLFWLFSLINIIPIIGVLIYIGVVCYIAFERTRRFPPSLKTFCKAYLILIAISIILCFLFFGAIMTVIAAAGAAV